MFAAQAFFSTRLWISLLCSHSLPGVCACCLFYSDRCTKHVCIINNRYDVPLDKQTSIATHNSFSSDRDLRTHSNFEVSLTSASTCCVKVLSIAQRSETRTHHVANLFGTRSSGVSFPVRVVYPLRFKPDALSYARGR